MTSDRDKTVIVPQEPDPTNINTDTFSFKRKPSGVIGGPTPAVGSSYDITDTGFNRRRLPKGMTIGQTMDFGGPEMAQGYFQSGWEQAAYIVPRVAVKVASEVAQMPGYLAGGLGWIANGAKQEDINMLIDNEWIKAIQGAEEGIKDKLLPVFSDYKDTYGSFTQQIFDPTFWAKEGADGVGFFISMLVPGQLLKAAGAGTSIVKGAGKLARLGKPGTKAASAAIMSEGAQAAAKWIDGGLAAAVNTLYEASAEAGEAYRNTQVKLAQEFPEMSEEQIRLKAGEAAAKTMRGNWAVLFGSNLVMEQLLWNQFSRGKGISKSLSATKDKAGALSFASSPLKKGKEFLKQVPKGIISEGFYEEGMQYALSEYYQNQALEGSPEQKSYGDGLGGLLNAYIDGLSDTDMQKSIFLGALLGSVAGGIGGIRTANQHNQILFGSKAKDPNFIQRVLGQRKQPERAGLIDLLNKNILERYSDIKDISKLDEKGEPILKEDGSYEIDYVKAAQYMMDQMTKQGIRDNLAYEMKFGEEEIYNYLKDINDFMYMLPFLRQEGGMEALQAHLDDLANLDKERQIQILGQENAQSVAEIKENLSNKARKYEKIVNAIEFEHSPRKILGALNIKEGQRGIAEEYVNGLLYAKFQSYLFQELATDNINRLKRENSTLDPEKARDASKIKDNEKYIKDYEAILADANKNWEQLNNGKELQKGFEDYVKEREIVQEAADAAKKTASSKTTREGVSLSPDIQALWEELHEVETVRDVKSDPYTGETRGSVSTDILHTAEVEISLIDKETGEVTTYEPVAGEKRKATFTGKVLEPNDKGRLIIKTPDGNITIRDANTAVYGTNTYDYSLTVSKTAQQVKEEDSLKVLQETIGGLITTYEKQIESAKRGIKTMQDKIKFGEKKLKEALKKGTTKSGQGRKIFIVSKNGARVYMNALEIQNTIEEIRTQRIPDLQAKIEKYEQNRAEAQSVLEDYVAQGKVSLNDINNFISALENKMKEEQDFITATRGVLDQKQDYLTKLLRSFKGLRTMFFNEVDKQTGSNFAQQQAEIRKSGLTDTEIDEALADLEKQAYRHVLATVVTVPGEARDAIKPLLAALERRQEKVDDTIANIQEIEDSLAVAEGKWRSLQQKFRKHYTLKNKLMQAYRALFPQKFKVDSVVLQEDQTGKHDNYKIESKIGQEEELAKKKIDFYTGEEKSAKHPFHMEHGVNNWLVTTGSTEAPEGTQQVVNAVYRWAGYLATMPINELRKIRVKTFTIQQVRELPVDHPIRKQITFFNGEEQVTEDKITAEQLEYASNEIKAVMMNNPSKDIARLVDEDGRANKDGKYLLYSVLVLPTRTTPTGHERFSLRNAIDIRAKELIKKQRFSEKKAYKVAEEQVEKEFEKSRSKYELWREEAKEKSKVLRIYSKNPGAKNATDQWLNVDEVVSGNVKNADIEIVGYRKGEDTSYVQNESGSKQVANTGFAYLKTQNSPELIKPKTLAETGSVEDFIKLLNWLMSNPNHKEFSLVKEYLKDQTLFLEKKDNEINDPSFKYRLFLKVAKSNKERVMSVVFGNNELTPAEVQTEQGKELLRDFLSNKLHRFNRNKLDSKELYNQFYINQKGVLARKSLKLTYKEFLFSSEGGNSVKGKVNLRPAKSTPFQMGQDPQYHNASLNLREPGNKPQKTEDNEAPPPAPPQFDTESPVFKKMAEVAAARELAKQKETAIEAPEQAPEASIERVDALSVMTASDALFNTANKAEPAEKKRAEARVERPPLTFELTQEDRDMMGSLAKERLKSAGIELSEENIDNEISKIIHEDRNKESIIEVSSTKNINDISPTDDGKINKEIC